jgi:integrase
VPRRANHEGGIRERDEGVWEASITFDGRRYYVRGKSRTEAQRELNDLKADHRAGELVAPSRVTVGEHLAEWLETVSSDLKPKTVREYEIVVRVWLTPAFGHIKLQHLTPAHIDRQFARWRSEGRAKGGTMLNAYRVLHRALVFAHRWGRIGRNPCDAVPPPRAVRDVPDLWDATESRRFLDALEPGRWESALFTILLGTGCRLGEALAMRWEDIDRDAGTASIRRNVTRLAGEWSEGAPKTRAGVRTVAMPAFTRNHLRDWRTAQLEERLSAGAAWTATGRVVTLPDGRTPSHRQCIDRFEARCEAAGAPRLRMHDLRHLHASMLLAEGLPVPAVSARLGHASPAITMTIYAHALKGQDAVAAGVIEAALTGS